MNYRYFIFYISKECKHRQLYANDERVTALRIYQYAKRHLDEGESVFLTVRTTTAMDKMKPQLTLSYYRPMTLYKGDLWRSLHKW